MFVNGTKGVYKNPLLNAAQLDRIAELSEARSVDRISKLFTNEKRGNQLHKKNYDGRAIIQTTQHSPSAQSDKRKQEEK